MLRFGNSLVRRMWGISTQLILTGSMTRAGIMAASSSAPFKVDKDKLKERLTSEQYHVTQERGTERPFTGVYDKHKEPGVYRCVVCDDILFASDSKFNSGCGWPAFSDVLDKSKVVLTKDIDLGMVRTEVTCANCGAHLGHVFDDGPKPTGQRYCINSASLNFKKKDA